MMKGSLPRPWPGAKRKIKLVGGSRRSVVEAGLEEVVGIAGRTVTFVAHGLKRYPPEVESVTGRHFAKQRPVPSSPASRDEAAAKRLWKLSEELTGGSSQGGRGTGLARGSP